MKQLITLTFTLLLQVTFAQAQQRKIPVDTTVITKDEVVIKGKKISYTAEAGMQPVWGADDKVSATLFYTYYKRTDVKDIDNRPLIISFNGGPGSASVWMHIGYTGPKLLKIDDEGFPVQPYGIKDNPYSILDVADIVFIDPVNTGYSRIVDEKADRKDFFGVNADIKYLAEWVNNFVTRKQRWNSPKYLIGESYGTDRVSGLAGVLQSSHWMYLNGVILVSPTNLGISSSGSVANAIILPYYTATAWYHNKLAPNLQERDLEDLLPEVEKFAINEFLPALVKGGSLSDKDKVALANRAATYSGLSSESFMQHNLNVPTNYFWKELLRSEGHTVGRLDSRYKGIDKMEAGISPDYNAELTSWLHSFTPAINQYLSADLNFKTDVKYNMFGSVHPWDRTNNRTNEQLRSAMAQNPNLHLLVQSGYYDGATDYFHAKYNLWQIDQAGQMLDRMDFIGYRSGHMMYLRKEDLEKSNEDIRVFIQKSLPKENAPAKF